MQAPRPAQRRPYLFYDAARSICSRCYRRVDGKILFQDGRVLLRRRCPEHGWETALLADDVDYYRRARELWIKPSELPRRWGTAIEHGCPYDCGLCPDHEQHACLSIVELTDRCNLRCPVCYAGSGPEHQGFRPLAQVEAMLDAVVRAEGEPDVVQLSGGEPTLHPEFFAILDAARARPIRHVMLNTNGVRLATDPDFAARLAAYRKGFEVYLQFDSLREAPLRRLRDADLRSVRQKALEACERHGLHTTLVVTVMQGVNDDELGEIIEHALGWSCVRGVTLQPVQHAGRTEGFDPATDRLTLTEVRRRVLEQSPRFAPDDIVPVPCHPDALAMAYGMRLGEGFVPLTRLVPREVLLDGPRSTIAFEKEPGVQEHVLKLISLDASPEQQAERLRDLLCCLPRVEGTPELGYDNIFRLLIIQFMDAWSFDLRSVKKSCVQFVHPDDGRLIPFDTYNLLYRGELEAQRVAPWRS